MRCVYVFGRTAVDAAIEGEGPFRVRVWSDEVALEAEEPTLELAMERAERLAERVGHMRVVHDTHPNRKGAVWPRRSGDWQ